MSVNRKRKKELRRLQVQANNLWESQQVLVGEAANVAPLIAEQTPNRVVIITCGVDDEQDVDVNIIVNATLTSSQKA